MDTTRLVQTGRDANLPPISDAAMTVVGSSLGTVHSSASLRSGVSACVMSEWYSDTSLACKPSSGFPGQNMDLVVTCGNTQSTLSSANSYDSPNLQDIGKQLSMPGDISVFLHGTNLGASDYSFRVTIGVYGCKSTRWVSDTSLQCLLNSGFTSSDITVQALKQAASCRTCLPHETLVRCTPAHPGICVECAPCLAGFFRDCYAGPASSGSCNPCPNENLPHDQRFFKPIVGTNKTSCTRCTVCKQDKEYQKQRCTTTTDTICDACGPCATGVRVGCGGDSAGRCVVMGSEISSVLGSASGVVKGSKISDSQLVVSEPFELWMTGPNNGTGLRISQSTVLNFASGIQDVSLSAISPTQKMYEALQDRALLRELGLARFGDNNTRHVFKMISPVIYCSPSGLSMSQAASVFFKINMDPIYANPNISIISEPVAASAYLWSTVNEKWERKTDVIFTNNSFEFRTKSFSSYVVLAPFNETFVGDPDWWLIESLGWSREEWGLFVFLPSGILLCCCLRLYFVFASKRTPASSIENDDPKTDQPIKHHKKDHVDKDKSNPPGARVGSEALRMEEKQIDGVLAGNGLCRFDALAHSGVFRPTRFFMKSASGPLLLDVNAVDHQDGTVFLSPVRNISSVEHSDSTGNSRTKSRLEYSDDTYFRDVSLRRSVLDSHSVTKQCGVGIALNRRHDGSQIVTDLNPQGPAAESGQVVVGDKLVSVDGVSLLGLSREEVSNMLLGQPGSLIQLVLDADAVATSSQMVDLSMLTSRTQPEPVRKQAALHFLRQRSGHDTQSAHKEQRAATPEDAQSESGVRRRADLDELEIGSRHRNSGIQPPTLLSGAQTVSGGRQGTAGSKSRFQRSNLESAFELLERTLRDHDTRQTRLEEDKRVVHMLNLRSEMQSSRGGPLSPTKVEPSSSSTASVVSMTTRSSETLGSLGVPSQGLGTPYIRQVGIVQPTGKRAKSSELPSLQFSRRSMPTTVPDVEVPLVFSPPSGRLSRAPSSQCDIQSGTLTQVGSSTVQRDRERQLPAATTSSALKAGRESETRSQAGNIADKNDRGYEGWASDW
jgi:hypothetical protein